MTLKEKRALFRAFQKVEEVKNGDCYTTAQPYVIGPAAVHDIHVSFNMPPADYTWLIDVIVDGSHSGLHWALNQRASMRWVAASATEFNVSRKLELMITGSPGQGSHKPPIIYSSMRYWRP